MLIKPLHIFSLDVVDFDELADAAATTVNKADVFDAFTWGDTSYALITATEAAEALRATTEYADMFGRVIDLLEMLPPHTMVNLGGDSVEAAEKAKAPLKMLTKLVKEAP